jgi:uncharacterized membrane protein YdbT with pleckstrin-like domain
MDLHPGEEIVFEGHPSWRGILGFYIKGLVLAIVVGAILWFAVSHGLGVAGLIVVFALTIVAGLIRRMATSYTITNERLNIRTGILSKHVQQTSIDRVQNVNTNQSLFERVLRVGRVDFDTAGTDDSDFTFTDVASPADIVAAVDRAQRLSRATAGSADAGAGDARPL